MLKHLNSSVADPGGDRAIPTRPYKIKIWPPKAATQISCYPAAGSATDGVCSVYFGNFVYFGIKVSFQEFSKDVLVYGRSRHTCQPLSRSTFSFSCRD